VLLLFSSGVLFTPTPASAARTLLNTTVYTAAARSAARPTFGTSRVADDLLPTGTADAGATADASAGAARGFLLHPADRNAGETASARNREAPRFQIASRPASVETLQPDATASAQQLLSVPGVSSSSVITGDGWDAASFDAAGTLRFTGSDPDPRLIQTAGLFHHTCSPSTVDDGKPRNFPWHTVTWRPMACCDMASRCIL
jgi:hypothetical protein